MLEDGYIKLHRKFLNWEWYKNANTSRLFLHLLLTANHYDEKFEGKEIKRGQRVCSIESLGAETGLSFQSTRTAISHLIATGELTSKSFNKYRIITINNYDEYQGATINQQSTNKQATSNQQQSKKARKQEYNNVVSNETTIESKTPFTEYANGNTELLNALNAFEDMRKKIKKPLTETAKKLLVGKLKKLEADGNPPVLVLEQSIMNCWQGVFELKEKPVVETPAQEYRYPKPEDDDGCRIAVPEGATLSDLLRLCGD